MKKITEQVDIGKALKDGCPDCGGCLESGYDYIYYDCEKCGRMFVPCWGCGYELPYLADVAQGLCESHPTTCPTPRDWFPENWKKPWQDTCRDPMEESIGIFADMLERISISEKDKEDVADGLRHLLVLHGQNDCPFTWCLIRKLATVLKKEDVEKIFLPFLKNNYPPGVKLCVMQNIRYLLSPEVSAPNLVKEIRQIVDHLMETATTSPQERALLLNAIPALIAAGVDATEIITNVPNKFGQIFANMLDRKLKKEPC
jgi:hypothetical protein